jgi:hypothetical protein
MNQTVSCQEFLYSSIDYVSCLDIADFNLIGDGKPMVWLICSPLPKVASTMLKWSKVFADYRDSKLSSADAGSSNLSPSSSFFIGSPIFEGLCPHGVQRDQR